MTACEPRLGTTGTTTIRRHPNGALDARPVGRTRPIRSMLCVLVLLAPALAACGGPGPTTPAPAAASDTSYGVGPGDKLRIMVFGQENMSGEYQVDGSGKIAFPLIGGVEAGGKSAPELEANMEEQLARYLKEPDVSIEVLNFRPFFVVGEVREPGDYPYVDDMSVLNAVAIAGGFTYRAREETFVIQRREGGETKKLEAGPTTTVMPGDVIVVRERYF